MYNGSLTKIPDMSDLEKFNKHDATDNDTSDGEPANSSKDIAQNSPKSTIKIINATGPDVIKNVTHKNTSVSNALHITGHPILALFCAGTVFGGAIILERLRF